MSFVFWCYISLRESGSAFRMQIRSHILVSWFYGVMCIQTRSLYMMAISIFLLLLTNDCSQRGLNSKRGPLSFYTSSLWLQKIHCAVHFVENCRFAICRVIIKICGFAICGLAHPRNLRICDCGMNPRILRICYLRTKKISLPISIANTDTTVP